MTSSVMNDMRNQSFMFHNLMPFMYYEFSVAAFAVTEILTHFGIPSDPVVARTDEDCKILRFSCVALTVISWCMII